MFVNGYTALSATTMLLGYLKNLQMTLHPNDSATVLASPAREAYGTCNEKGCWDISGSAKALAAIAWGMDAPEGKRRPDPMGQTRPIDPESDEPSLLRFKFEPETPVASFIEKHLADAYPGSNGRLQDALNLFDLKKDQPIGEAIAAIEAKVRKHVLAGLFEEPDEDESRPLPQT